MGTNIVGRDITYTRPVGTPEGDWQAEVKPKDWKPPLECGYKIPQTIAATTYADLCIDGDWARIQLLAQTYGTTNLTINQGGVGTKVISPYQEPPYVSVFFDNIEWRVRVNKEVIVPTIIADILRDSGYVR